MRPTKLTHKLLDAFRTVLADELAAIAFTEEELVWQANQRLVPEERISYRTYQRYKAEILVEEEQGDELIALDVDDEEDHNAELVQQMYTCLKSAMLQQKLALVRGVYEGLPNWRRFSWMLERKFPDFKLRLPQGKQEAEKLPGKREKEPPKGRPEETPEGKEQRAAAWLAKMHAAAEAAKPKTVEEKWEKRYIQPWKPMHEHSCFNYRRDELRAIEEEMERDVAAGYVNPYAYLGYRPDTEVHEQGFYKFFGMGEDRLPLRVLLLREIDEPPREEREGLWEEQERKRKNIIRAEQGLPPMEPPSPLPERSSSQIGGRILGHS